MYWEIHEYRTYWSMWSRMIQAYNFTSTMEINHWPMPHGIAYTNLSWNTQKCPDLVEDYRLHVDDVDDKKHWDCYVHHWVTVLRKKCPCINQSLVGIFHKQYTMLDNRICGAKNIPMLCVCYQVDSHELYQECIKILYGILCTCIHETYAHMPTTTVEICGRC